MLMGSRVNPNLFAFLTATKQTITHMTTQSIFSYTTVKFPGPELTLVTGGDDCRWEPEGDDRRGNGAPVASHVDAALCDVADYLRAHGICHPDVIQNRCRTLVDHAQHASGQDSHSQNGVDLRLASLRLAADWVGKLHDDLIVDCVSPTQHYISTFDDLISDPSLLKRERVQSLGVQDQLCRRVCRVVPNAQRQPMRHTETPALIGPLRRQWWTTKVARSWVSLRGTAETLCRVVGRRPISNAN